MKKIRVLIILVILLMSCSQKEDKETANSNCQTGKVNTIAENQRIAQSHEILNLILERWAPLSNTLLRRKNGDTIPIHEIVLVPLSYVRFNIDTTQNGFSIKPHRFDITYSPEFPVRREALIAQMNQEKPIKWDSRLFLSTIKIDPDLTENKVSFPSKIHDKNSFLIVSEPFQFDKNLYFVCGQLYTKKILLDILYIVEKDNNKFKIIDAEAAMIKLVIQNKPAIRQKDGSTTREILVAVFDGYE